MEESLRFFMCAFIDPYQAGVRADKMWPGAFDTKRDRVSTLVLDREAGSRS